MTLLQEQLQQCPTTHSITAAFEAQADANDTVPSPLLPMAA